MGLCPFTGKTASVVAKKPKKSSGPKKKKPAPRPEEEQPILSGRMIIALAFALAMSVIPVSKLGPLITKTSPETTARAAWKVGQTARIHITTVTSDYDELACASMKRLGDAHCEWENERERWPAGPPSAPIDDSKLTTLQPFRTTDRQLVLLPGFWAQPDVATRLHQEPPHGVSSAKLARFVVSCDVKFVEEWKTPMIRWKPSERWSGSENAMVGEIESCEILEEERS